MRPVGIVFVQGVTKVDDLLVAASDAWNNTRIDDMFTPDDAVYIKQIAIGGPAMEDDLAWNYTKNGYLRCARLIT